MHRRLGEACFLYNQTITNQSMGATICSVGWYTCNIPHVTVQNT